MSLSGNYSNPTWGAAAVTWSRTASLDSELVRSFLRGSTSVNLASGFQTGFEIDYSLADRSLNLGRVSLTYNVQCCGFRAEYARYDFGSLRQETALRFEVTLANMGSFAGFLGGKAERDSYRLRGEGPQAIVTDIGIMEPDELGELVLTALHPGKTIQEAKDNTGWSLRISEDLRTTPPPTDQELHILHDQLDPDGIYVS